MLDTRVKRYQLLLHAVPDPSLSSVMARVIGRANRPFLQTMILDGRQGPGRQAGAGRDRCPRHDRAHLPGRRPHCLGHPAHRPEQPHPGGDRAGNIQAIMAGDNSAAPQIDLLSQNVVLRPGMQVVSSGDGGLLPPGLAIGSVIADPSGGSRVVLLGRSVVQRGREYRRLQAKGGASARRFAVRPAGDRRRPAARGAAAAAACPGRSAGDRRPEPRRHRP
ncbi:MAG: hypothetical protein WDM81_04115 [Rhizomicrobium sp.]